MRHHHKNVKGKAQNAVDAPSDAVLDHLALQVRRAREISSDAFLEKTEGPEEEAFYLAQVTMYNAQ